MSERRETGCEDAHPVILVLGLGNPLRGDDGVGPRIIEELEHRGLPEAAQTLDGGTGGLDLLHVMEGWDRVIIIDAADLSDAEQSGPAQPAPGQFVRFTPDQVHLAEAAERFSFHHAGLAEVLALAHALDRPLPPIVVFGVQPKSVGWGEGLSPEVEEGLPALLNAILEEATAGLEAA